MAQTAAPITLDANQKNVPLICSGHSRPVPDISFSRVLDGGFKLISACLDSNPMLRDGVTGDWIGTFLGHKGATWSARLNRDATRAVSASADFTMKLWDATTGDELQSFTHKHIVKTAEFNGAETHIISGGMDKTLRLFDLGATSSDPVVVGTHEGAIRYALWLGESSVISGGADGLRVFDTRACKEVKKIATQGAFRSFQLSDDGSLLTITCGREVKFLNVASMEFIKSYLLPFEVGSAAVHPGRARFVAGGHDFYAHVYNFENGTELEVHKGHHGPIHAVKYSPDGEIFASAGEDGTIRLWQTEIKPYGLWQYPLSEAEREKERKEREEDRAQKKEEENKKKEAKRLQQEEAKKKREAKQAAREGKKGGADDAAEAAADDEPAAAEEATSTSTPTSAGTPSKAAPAAAPAGAPQAGGQVHAMDPAIVGFQTAPENAGYFYGAPQNGFVPLYYFDPFAGGAYLTGMVPEQALSGGPGGMTGPGGHPMMMMGGMPPQVAPPPQGEAPRTPTTPAASTPTATGTPPVSTAPGSGFNPQAASFAPRGR